jgi:transposase
VPSVIIARAFEAIGPIDGRDERQRGLHTDAGDRHQPLASVDYTGRITKRGDGTVRRLLYEAANSILTRFKGTMAVKSWALRIAKRAGMKKARIALARRLAVIMHAMMMDGTEFAMA